MVRSDTSRCGDFVRSCTHWPTSLRSIGTRRPPVFVSTCVGATVREVLGACNAAIEKSGVLHQNGSDFTGNIPGGARERLNAMASERITKAEGKETYEQAFAAVVRANPHLYTQYLKEEHSGRR